ncbi:hypothetical protein [Cohnella sp.]|uniref:hypothetical protein n=1 Tax=Cohnella sp. TaxID=1883426 RepID=UPI003568B7E2
MEDRITVSLFFLIFIIWGIAGILFPEFMYKTTATNTLKKTPSRSAIKRYKISGYVMLIIGVSLIIVTLLGGLKGI